MEFTFDEIDQKLSVVQARCTIRTLSTDKGCRATVLIDAIEIFNALLDIPDAQIKVEIHGGVVSKSYNSGHGGQTSWVVLQRHGGIKTCNVYRGYALTSRYGKESWIARVELNGKYILRL